VGEMVKLDDGAGEMPRARVLSYVTSTGSPTQVRYVAGMSALWIGVLMLIIGAGTMWLAGTAVWDAYRFSSGRGAFAMPWIYASFAEYLPKGTVGLLSIMRAWDRDGWGLCGLVLVWVCCGVGLVASSGAVKRGNASVCVLCRLALVPPAVALLVAAAETAGQALVFGIGIGRHAESEPEQFYGCWRCHRWRWGCC
jgi:hypothetical protein